MYRRDRRGKILTENQTDMKMDFCRLQTWNYMETKANGTKAYWKRLKSTVLISIIQRC